MCHRIGLRKGVATLRVCAGWEGPTRDLERFYSWAAKRLADETGESWGAGRVEYWLRRECWGAGWVTPGTLELTTAGLVELGLEELRRAA